MSSIYLPSRGVQDWRALLADPEKHWRVGYSAMTLALSWEAAGGLPPEIAAMFGALGPDPELLVGLPEHKISLERLKPWSKPQRSLRDRPCWGRP